jgi:hypothetical protein
MKKNMLSEKLKISPKVIQFLIQIEIDLIGRKTRENIKI